MAFLNLRFIKPPRQINLDCSILWLLRICLLAYEQYTRLGFALTPRGHHSRGTSNHLAIFGDDYLELIGVEPQHANKPGVKWEDPHGLVGLVLKTADADATWQHLSQRDIALEGDAPSALSRVVEVDGRVLGTAQFRTMRIAPDLIPNGRVFFCEHSTPELVWQSQWQSHPNGATGLAEYVYLAPDPQAASAWLARAYGTDNVTQHAHGLRFQLGSVSVWYLTAAGIAEHYGIDASSLPTDIDRAIGLTVKVKSLATTHKLLQQNGVDVIAHHEQQIVIEPEQAQGVILAFV